MIGNYIGKESAHVAQFARVLDQLIEQVMFQAGCGRLHPSQLFGGRQEFRRNFSEKSVGVSNFGCRGLFIACVDDRNFTSGFSDEFEPTRIDGWVQQELHDSCPLRCEL
jgi:hypothetical protein